LLFCHNPTTPIDAPPLGADGNAALVDGLIPPTNQLTDPPSNQPTNRLTNRLTNWTYQLTNCPERLTD
jgi:hypothetical protein